MPSFLIEILEGRTVEQKRELAKRSCAIAVEHLGVPAAEVYCRISEIKFADMFKNDRASSEFTTPDGQPVYGNEIEPRVYMKLPEDLPRESLRSFVAAMAQAYVDILGVRGIDTQQFIQAVQVEELVVGGVTCRYEYSSRGEYQYS